jgi:hypothetical protein
MSSSINYDDVMIGAVGAISDTMNSMDTIILNDSADVTLSGLSSTIIGPYTSTNYPTYGNITIGSSGSAGTFYTTNATSTPSWQTINAGSGSQSSLNVKGNAEFEGKVKINGQDLAEFMDTISKRLAILVPNPEKLEHFEALKKAYNHYKTLEALCEIPKEEEDK